jgi:hypothetical protein
VKAGGEGVGSGADEHDVGRALHDGAGERDGMAGALDVGNGSGAEGEAVHDGGVELIGAVGGKDGAASGVEERIVLKKLDGGLDGIERGAAFVEHGGGGGESFADSGAVGGFGLGGHAGALHDSRAAVEDDGPLVRRGHGRGTLTECSGSEGENDKDAGKEVHGR